MPPIFADGTQLPAHSVDFFSNSLLISASFALPVLEPAPLVPPPPAAAVRNADRVMSQGRSETAPAVQREPDENAMPGPAVQREISEEELEEEEQA